MVPANLLTGYNDVKERGTLRALNCLGGLCPREFPHQLHSHLDTILPKVRSPELNTIFQLQFIVNSSILYNFLAFFKVKLQYVFLKKHFKQLSQLVLPLFTSTLPCPQAQVWGWISCVFIESYCPEGGHSAHRVCTDRNPTQVPIPVTSHIYPTNPSDRRILRGNLAWGQ